MRKGNMTILTSIFMIALVAAGIGMGTMAYFSDRETSDDNVIVAGTIDLDMRTREPSTSVMFEFLDVKPCKDMDPIFIELENVGQNNGYLYQKIDYEDHDKDVPGGSEFIGDMSADMFAALIYVKSITYQHFGTGGYVGTPRDDLPGMKTAMDSNTDGFLSLYEMKNFGWIPYDSEGETDPDPKHTLQVGHTATWTIVFHMGDSLEGWVLEGAILKDVEDNRPQADGIELTWTAVLRQNPHSVNPLPAP